MALRSGDRTGGLQRGAEQGRGGKEADLEVLDCERQAGQSCSASGGGKRPKAEPSGRLYHPQGCEPYPEVLLRVFRVSAPNTRGLCHQDAGDTSGEAAVQDPGGRRHGVVRQAGGELQQTAFPDPEGENTQKRGPQET